MNKKFISLLIVVFVTVIGYYFLHKTIPATELSYSGNNLETSKNNTDEQTLTGYLVKYEGQYIFEDCYGGQIYIIGQLPDSKLVYKNINNSVSISIINSPTELSIKKIDILNGKCNPKDNVQLIQDKLIGYGSVSEGETYIQDGYYLALNSTKSVGTKNIFNFQFLHYGDPKGIYQTTLTIEKYKILDDKYEIKTMDPNDIFEAKGKVAVFFSPSDAEITEMKKNDEHGFYTVADDNSYYESIAREFLKKSNIKTVYTNKRYINFIRDNPDSGNQIFIDTMAIGKDEWGVLLFDGKKEPIRGDMVNIQPDYDKYFKGK
jgi:hypothetical protein